MSSSDDPARTPDRLLASFEREVDFGVCLEAQLATRDALAADPERSEGRLFMVEHRPALTLGRRGKREDVLWSDAQLAEVGMRVFETPRGGEVTLHAPGQLVAYPIVRVGRQIRAHIHHLADATLAVAERYGVRNAAFEMDQPGIWLAPEPDRPRRKLASIGLHVSRGITVQGLSFNIDVAPMLFGALVSCGLPEVEMVSLRELVEGELPPLETLAREWAEAYAECAGMRLEWC